MDELTDVRYEVEDGLAWIVIDRPDRMNAFRARTVDGQLAFSGLETFLGSEDAREGLRAFAEKRAPDFARFRAGAASS